MKIMVLARWASETISRYVKEALLGSLPDEVLALEGKRILPKLLSKLADGVENFAGKVADLMNSRVCSKKIKKRKRRISIGKEARLAGQPRRAILVLGVWRADGSFDVGA